ncbi:hypothetical protein MTO96_026316 [Rhipicephalus appendiculatus]
MITAGATPDEDDCGLEYLDLDDAMTQVMAQLSARKDRQRNISFHEGLLNIECCNVTGLDHLRQYGPVMPYCIDDTPYIQVDLVNDAPLEVTMNWMTCTGLKGALVVGARLSRFTLKFEVVEWSRGGAINLWLEDPVVPVATEMTYAVVTGCDFAGMDLDYAVWNVLTRLPSDKVMGPTGFTPFLPGIEIGVKKLIGFNKMIRYGPLVPYCVDGVHMVQVDLINSEDVSMSAQWKDLFWARRGSYIAEPIGAFHGCDFSGMDLDYAVWSVLTQLPSEHFMFTRFTPFLPGIEIGVKKLNGFNKMIRYGPLVPYCMDGKHMVQVDLINSEDVSMSAQWKACSGHEGEVILRNPLARFTVQFRAVPHPVHRAYRLEFEDAVVPVVSAYPYVVIEGAGQEARAASMWLSKIFPMVPQKLWNDYFPKYLQSALRDAVRSLYGGGPIPALFWERLRQ